MEKPTSGIESTLAYLLFIADWWSLMSGALTIPFGLAALFTQGHPKTLFTILAFAALLLTSSGLVRRILELKETLRPKFKIDCAFDTLGTCVCSILTVPTGQIGATFYRVRVEADVAGEIEGCTGTITLIEKDSQIRMGHETLRITFSPGDEEDATSKVLRGKVPEFLDVMMITEAGDVIPCTKGFKIPNAINLNALFNERGDYILTVVIAGRGVPSQVIHLKFFWGGHRSTSNMTLRDEAVCT